MYFHRPVIFPCWASRARLPDQNTGISKTEATQHFEASPLFHLLPAMSWCWQIQLMGYMLKSQNLWLFTCCDMFSQVNGYTSITAGCFGVQTRVLVHPQMCKSGNMSISEHILASCSCFHLFQSCDHQMSPILDTVSSNFSLSNHNISQY